MAKSKTSINSRVFTRQSMVDIRLKRGSIEIEDNPGEFMTIHFVEMTAQASQERTAKSITRGGKVDYSKATELEIDTFLAQVTDENGLKIFPKASSSNGTGPTFSTEDKEFVGSLGRTIVAPVAKEVLELSGLADKDTDKLQEWMKDKQPDLLEKYREEMGPIEQAKKNSD